MYMYCNGQEPGGPCLSGSAGHQPVYMYDNAQEPGGPCLSGSAGHRLGHRLLCDRLGLLAQAGKQQTKTINNCFKLNKIIAVSFSSNRQFSALNEPFRLSDSNPVLLNREGNVRTHLKTAFTFLILYCT